MKRLLFLAGAFLLSLGAEAKNCDKLGVLLYEDLVCKPVRHDGEGDCPSGFECEKWTSSKEHCRLRGTKYPVGDTVDNDLTYASCDVGCTCRHHNEEESAGFTCAILDCPEWLGTPVKPGCHRKYELGKCCSTGSVCPPYDESVTCKVDGETYKLGQRFIPKGTCMTCVCDKGFKEGEYVEPYCARQVCSVELKHTNSLENHCAPVYYLSEGDEALCCPTSWACPDGDLKLEANPSGKAEKTCKFGDKVVKGDEQFVLSVEEFSKKREVTCQCVMPPLVTCTGRW